MGRIQALGSRAGVDGGGIDKAHLNVHFPRVFTPHSRILAEHPERFKGHS